MNDLIKPMPGLLQWWGQTHTESGRPIMRSPVGEPMTEYTITVMHPALNKGRPTNIPSIWNGQIVNEDEAVRFALQSRGPWPSYTSIEQAEKAAGQRSQKLGGLLGLD